MPNLNQVNVMGLLTRDPETRFTTNGLQVTDLTIAVNHTWKTDSGEKRTECDYIDIVFFGRQAEIAAQYLKKASPAFVQGRLKLETWDDKQTGQKRSKLRVVGDNLQLIGGRPQTSERQPSGSAPAAPPVPTRPPAPKSPRNPNEEPDDIPF